MWPGASVSHETRESGIAEGCRWYSRTRANQFGVVQVLTVLQSGCLYDTMRSVKTCDSFVSRWTNPRSVVVGFSQP